MKQVITVSECQQAVQQIKQSKQSIGFIPTMGALHEGHLSLITTAKKTCDIVVVSIFVNPTQFGPSEDFESYPRQLKSDNKMLECHEIDILFIPTEKIIYPTSPSTQVTIPKWSKKYCGQSRPQFFDGITSVVCRLLHIIQPDFAFFGEKDFQQLVLIKKMVSDLFMKTHIIGCPIIREVDGLAMSSRNVYLSASERDVANQIYRSLCKARDLFQSGISSAKDCMDEVTSHLSSFSSIRIDYVEIVNPTTLNPISKQVSKGDRLLIAAHLGQTRLVDNIAFV